MKFDSRYSLAVRTRISRWDFIWSPFLSYGGFLHEIFVGLGVGHVGDGGLDLVGAVVGEAEVYDYFVEVFCAGFDFF